MVASGEELLLVRPMEHAIYVEHVHLLSVLNKDPNLRNGDYLHPDKSMLPKKVRKGSFVGLL